MKPKLITRIGSFLTTSNLIGYLFAMFASLCMVVLKLSVPDQLGFNYPYLLVTFAVIVSTMYGGLGAGLFSVLLTDLMVKYLFINPIGSFAISSDEILSFVAYNIQVTIISLLIESQRKTEQKLKLANFDLVQAIYKKQKADRNRKESEQRFRLITENSKDLVSMITPSGKFVYLNKSYEDLLGFSLEEIYNISPIGIIHPDDRENIKWKRFDRLEVRLLKKDGGFVWVERTVFPIKWRGRPYFAVMERDVTERKILEDRKDEFISIASHELKTPITTIKGFTQILIKILKDPKAIDYLGRMNTQVDRLTSLVSDLLDVSKIQAGKLVLNREVINLEEISREVISDLNKTYPTHKIVLKNKSKKIPIVNADKYRINQVLINLVTNAIKYSPEESSIEVNIETNKESAIVSVRDFGIGISKGNLNKIFAPFFQANIKSRQSFSGLGLGLHISKDIINRHKGEIWATSKLGKGSTFFFSLPRIK